MFSMRRRALRRQTSTPRPNATQPCEYTSSRACNRRSGACTGKNRWRRGRSRWTNSTWRLNTTRRRRRRCEIVREILWWSDVLTHRAGESESGGADRVTSGVVVASLGGVCRTVGIDVRFGDATRRARKNGRRFRDAVTDRARDAMRFSKECGTVGSLMTIKRSLRAACRMKTT